MATARTAHSGGVTPAGRLGLDTPRGAWAALLYYALLALGSAIPHRPVAGASGTPSGPDGVRRPPGEPPMGFGSAVIAHRPGRA